MKKHLTIPTFILLTSLFISMTPTNSVFSNITGSGSGTGTGTGSNASLNTQKLTPPKTLSDDELKQHVDKNKDGKISQEEISISIEEYFDGNTKFSLEDLQGLVSSFFD